MPTTLASSPSRSGSPENPWAISLRPSRTWASSAPPPISIARSIGPSPRTTDRARAAAGVGLAGCSALGEQLKHGCRLQGLSQMMVESRLLSPEAVGILPVTSDGDETYALQPREPPELSGGFVSVYAGHPDVEKDHLWPEGDRAGQRGQSIVGDLDLVAGQGEKYGQGLGRIHVVLGHQDSLSDGLGRGRLHRLR